MGAAGSAVRRTGPRRGRLGRIPKRGAGESLPMCRVRKVSHAILSDGRGFGQCNEAATEGGQDAMSYPEADPRMR
jgi:hypothetical protein